MPKNPPSEQMPLFKEPPEGPASAENDVKMPDLQTVESGVVIPLESDTKSVSAMRESKAELPELPARWEAARTAAERKNVLQVLLRQIRRVQALDYLEYLITLSKDEGYVWVVYGESGSGKSAFFHTLEYQTNNQIRTHIIDGNSPDINLSNQVEFSKYLASVIVRHKEKNGEAAPLVIVLEERENSMSTDERSSIGQALRNVLRPPGPGRNVIFVLPVTNSNQGTLFLNQARDTGVSTPLGQNAIFTFQGPAYTEHVDILSSLFVALNDRDISDFGLQRSDLQAYISSQQTIGQYIRTIREELVKQNRRFLETIRSNSYKPFTVIICFVNPLPAYRTEPIIKGMTINAFGKVRTGELLRVSQSQKAQKWQNKHQSLANIVEALDIRIAEVPPEIVTKLLFAYGWQNSLSNDSEQDFKTLIEAYLRDNDIDYNAPKSVRQNLRQQLQATNMVRIIFSEETRSYSTPKYLGQEQPSRQEQKRSTKELAEISITELACKMSHRNQQDFHKMFASALDDLLQNSGNISSVSDFKVVYPEAWLTLTDQNKVQKKVIRPDVVIEMQDRLFFLEFCWRSDEHFTYGDIASYILRKIQDSYMNLPLVRALAEG